MDHQTKQIFNMGSNSFQSKIVINDIQGHPVEVDLDLIEKVGEFFLCKRCSEDNYYDDIYDVAMHTNVHISIGAELFCLDWNRVRPLRFY